VKAGAATGALPAGDERQPSREHFLACWLCKAMETM
jgi:hypothetical protein